MASQNKNKTFAELIINEMNYIVQECNKYVKKEQDPTDEILWNFDITLAAIYIALTCKYIKQYNLTGLKKAVLDEYKEFYRPFLSLPSVNYEGSIVKNLYEMIDVCIEYFPPVEKKHLWAPTMQEFLVGSEDKTLSEFFINQCDENLIYILLEHVGRADKLLKELASTHQKEKYE